MISKSCLSVCIYIYVCIQTHIYLYRARERERERERERVAGQHMKADSESVGFHGIPTELPSFYRNRTACLLCLPTPGQLGGRQRECRCHADAAEHEDGASGLLPKAVSSRSVLSVAVQCFGFPGNGCDGIGPSIYLSVTIVGPAQTGSGHVGINGTLSGIVDFMTLTLLGSIR